LDKIYLIIFLIFAVFGLSQYWPSDLPGGTEIATITQVVDGDTVHVSINGHDEKVRLIGIDTPETVDPRKEVECFGQEAKDFLSQYEGTTVKLEADESQGDRDKYGRLLRYIWVDDINLNLLMIEKGFAYEYTYDDPYLYQVQFQMAETAAKATGVGLWNKDICPEYS